MEMLAFRFYIKIPLLALYGVRICRYVKPAYIIIISGFLGSNWADLWSIASTSQAVASSYHCWLWKYCINLTALGRIYMETAGSMAGLG